MDQHGNTPRANAHRASNIRHEQVQDRLINAAVIKDAVTANFKQALREYGIKWAIDTIATFILFEVAAKMPPGPAKARNIKSAQDLHTIAQRHQEC